MIFAWIGYCLLVSALLGLAALGVERALGHYRRPVRGVWTAALIGSLVLPIAAYVAPTLVERFGAVAEVLPVSIGATIALPELSATPAAGFDRSGLVSAAGVALGVGWGLSIIVFGFYLAGMHRRLRQEMAGWTPGEILDAPVMMSPDRGPAVVGMGRGVIVMPAWISDLEEDVLRLIFLHEREHQLAGDNRLFSLGLLALAAMPWNPIAWWQLRRLRLAIEFDCDRRVMAHGIAPREYAEALLAVGSRLTSAPLAAFAFAERTPAVERRLRRMTAPLGRLRGPRAALAVVSSALAVVVACGSPLPMNAPATADPEVSVVPDADEPEAVKAAPADAAGPRFIPYDTPPVLENRESMADALDRHYPEDARAENLGGRTELWIFIDEEGSVSDFRIKTSSGDGRFDKAAIEVMKAARFTPALNQGEETGVWVSQWVTFEQEGARMLEGASKASKAPPLEESQAGPDPMMVIDGVRVDRGRTLALPKVNIESVEVLKGETALAEYGADATHGVVVVTTKDGSGPVYVARDQADELEPDAIIVRPSGQGAAGVVRRAPGQSAQAVDVPPPPPPTGSGGVVSRRGSGPPSSGRTERPLIVIDGVLQSESTTLAGVGELDIDHVEVIKGEAARQIYGDRAKDGVVQITTKSFAADASADTVTPGEDVRLETDAADPKLKPLLVVDGVIMEAGVEVTDLDDLDIESVEVIKGEAAARMYGDRAKNGVIKVKTKGGRAR